MGVVGRLLCGIGGGGTSWFAGISNGGDKYPVTTVI